MKILEINPDFVDAYINLGAVCSLLGRRDDAIAFYSDALRINPQLPGTHYTLGLAYFEKGMIDDAIREYETALEINPDLLVARRSLNEAYKLIELDSVNKVQNYKRETRNNPVPTGEH